MASGASAQLNPAVRLDREAAPMAHQAVHDTVLEILQKLPGGKLLDVPAGEGALSARLLAAGFDVSGCDIYPEIFRPAKVEIMKGDLGAQLPYATSSFDYIACIEGLEHLENPQQAVREFARLLKSGGHLVTSVPNILNVEERLKTLIFGYTSHFKPITRSHITSVREQFGGKEEMALHINPIGYPELRYMLEKNGFEIVKLYRDKAKRKAWLYWPLVALIRLVGRSTPAQKQRDRWTIELQSNEVLLGGNTLIVHAILSKVVKT